MEKIMIPASLRTVLMKDLQGTLQDLCSFCLAEDGAWEKSEESAKNHGAKAVDWFMAVFRPGGPGKHGGSPF
jgi:hypothetical protein